MRILMTTDTVGGVWQYSLDLSSSLHEEQVEVVLLSMGPNPTTAQMEQVKNIPNILFHHLNCKLEWMENPWNDLEKSVEWLKEKVHEYQPNLLHFNSYVHVNSIWDVPVILVAHSCIATWWKNVKKSSLPQRYQNYFDTVKEAFHKADVVVAPSKSIMEEYKEMYGEIQNSHIIYNALGSTPKTHEETEKKPIIFSMGRLWDEAKNVKLIVEASEKINADVYIAGDNKRLFLPEEKVTFLGKLGRNEILEWLNKSMIYMLPVKYEPFGLSFLEAASQKCALVGGDINTLKELWGDAMLYVDTKNAAQLADTCNNLLSDRGLCKKMGERAFEKAKNYTIEKKKNQYLKLYKDLISQKTEKQFA